MHVLIISYLHYRHKCSYINFNGSLTLGNRKRSKFIFYGKKFSDVKLVELNFALNALYLLTVSLYKIDKKRSFLCVIILIKTVFLLKWNVNKFSKQLYYLMKKCITWSDIVIELWFYKLAFISFSKFALGWKVSIILK